ncbi:unnamed protein product [Linum tenue]|uniref:Domain X domain-containing protein n=1 Tax=Linum tenue TaxID=586396 RepID=A0AAV0GNU6_9ROSI|nr:unnamed protein product [Linum tenue]
MLRRTVQIRSQFKYSFPFRRNPYSTAAAPLPETSTEEPIIKPLTETQLKSLVLSNCSYGKFYNLIHNVVALPQVLLAASRNLITCGDGSCAAAETSIHRLVSKRFSIEDMGREVYEARLNIESHCVKFAGKDDCLILPDLKLKVLIEAVRMVLEIVYDDRFLTFSYGGRVNMGRHTAIRYLKNSVENPSWWFRVQLERQEFDSRNVEMLCLILEDKVKDKNLIGLIKRLFDSGVLRIELGGLYLGRGFPQECGLCSILINVYFNGFDREIQDTRLQLNRENPRRINVDDSSQMSSPLYKPVRMYAVRYLDEILVIASGPKKLAIGLKSRFLKSLESDLKLKVNKGRTIVHSAVFEKMCFMGFELQAVKPSVLHPPMSEKAIRARKKYLRQKEVRALELKNARERNRKKLGLKILRHVVKKAKLSNGFKLDNPIDNEVQQVFATWANEAVHDFLGSLEERWNWHRLLTTGDFLNLRHIRDMLPQELIESYDKFQKQVEKYLSPVKARKALEDEERRSEEAYERKYAERTIKDLTKLSMKVSAPIELVREAVRLAGFTNDMGRPRPISWLTSLEDADIIKWYAGVGRRWLDFFCCCHNFEMVKTIVTYHLRFSCILTLAEKHEATKRETMKHYTKNLRVSYMEENDELHFPTEKEVKMLGDKNLSDPKPVDGALSLALIRLACDEPLSSCVAHFCDRTDTITYRVRLLQNLVSANPADEKKWVTGMGAIHDSLHRICLPLCPDHISNLYTGKISLQDIDCCSFVHVD